MKPSLTTLFYPYQNNQNPLHITFKIIKNKSQNPKSKREKTQIKKIKI
jgi:hypothetical protein